MDAEALRTVAELAPKRAARGGSAADGDGMERLGAGRAMQQFAIDLEITADEFDRPRPRRKP